MLTILGGTWILCMVLTLVAMYKSVRTMSFEWLIAMNVFNVCQLVVMIVILVVYGRGI